MVLAIALSMMAAALLIAVGTGGESARRLCVPLDLDGAVCPAEIAQHVDREGRWYAAANEFTHLIGQVDFGNTILPGSCDYAKRTVFVEESDTARRVVKIRTTYSGLGVLLQEFIETQPGSSAYVELQRTPIHFDLNSEELPEHLYPLYNTESRSTDIDVHPRYRNTHRIGTVVVSDQVVEDLPCVSRSVTIFERRDGRRVVTVASVHQDDTLSHTLLIEQTAGRRDFVPYDPDNRIDDVHVGTVEADLDLDFMFDFE
ncbi:signal peptide containing protein [Babesia caballi]|uniref:Signal peptide containing protein n=1 Tax=Babesia caballi TaxID=5871 RepID=A0AAV4LP31_BABCB|nr:signal peptide containing protein [Babesia caballi]